MAREPQTPGAKTAIAANANTGAPTPGPAGVDLGKADQAQVETTFTLAPEDEGKTIQELAEKYGKTPDEIRAATPAGTVLFDDRTQQPPVAVVPVAPAPTTAEPTVPLSQVKAMIDQALADRDAGKQGAATTTTGEAAKYPESGPAILTPQGYIVPPKGNPLTPRG